MSARARRAAFVILGAVSVAISAAPSDLSLARSGAKPPLEQRLGLRPGLQLAAMRSAIAAAPNFYVDYDSGCVRTTPVLAYSGGNVMAGNVRGQDGACYVWLNLAQAPLVTAQEICKLALHEMGHLGGLQHSPDPDDVMYSPFRSDPIPGPCQKPLG